MTTEIRPTAEQQAALDLFATGRSFAIEAGAGFHASVAPGYTVTPAGEAWSWWRSNGRKPRVLSPRPYRRLSPGIAGSNGYEQIWLYINGERHGRFIHLLVLEAFVGPCPAGCQARHLDGNERNNRLGNLRWGTPVENMADRDEHGRTARGEAVGTAVLTAADVAGIRLAHQGGESVRSLARQWPVSRRQIGRIVKRESWA